LIKNSNEESLFIKDITSSLKNTCTHLILSVDVLEMMVQTIANSIESIWYKHSKTVNITKYSKAWWNNNCNQDLKKYRQTRQLKDWKKFKGLLKELNMFFLTIKLMKSPTRNTDLITNKLLTGCDT